MVSIDKIFILAFSSNIEKKKEVFRERLKTISFSPQPPLEIIDLPSRSQLGKFLIVNNLQLHEGWNFDTSNGWKDISLAAGHWRAWQKAKNDEKKTILILEEDFIAASFYDHMLPSINQPWELLYLGRHSNGGDVLQESGWVIPGYSNGSIAYVLNDSGIHKLLTSGFEHSLIPIGDFLTTMHDAHADTRLRSRYSGNITALAAAKNFIERDDSWPLSNDPLETVKEVYIPLHRSLYEYSKSPTNWISKYLNRQLVHKEFELICDEPIENIYSFPIFTPLFCKEIIEEAERYGQWSNYRGKDLEPIDMLLSAIGFDDIYNSVIKEYVFPLFKFQYQLRGEAWMKLNSQNFIVRYLSDKQGHLGIHHDGSYLSMVITLNTDYKGGGTYFPKFKKLIRHDQPGYATVHPGLVGYLHGARPVTQGTRYILASFFFPGSKPPIADGFY